MGVICHKLQHSIVTVTVQWGEAINIFDSHDEEQSYHFIFLLLIITSYINEGRVYKEELVGGRNDK